MKRLCQFILVMIFTLVLVGCGDFNQNQNCEHTFESGVCLKCGLEEEIPYEYNKTKFDGKNMQIIIYCNTSDTDPFNPIYYKTDVESKKQRVLDIEEAYNIDIVFQEYPSDAKWGYERFEWIKANSLKTNTSNHIYSLNSNWVKALAEANAIAELYDESTSTGILKELKVGINEYMKEYSKDSKIYGYEVEHTHANSFMHYNINLIEEYGLEDPAALWNEGRWTYTQFFNYIENAQIEFNKNETTKIYSMGGTFSDVTLGLISGSGYKLIDDERVLVQFVNSDIIDIYLDCKELFKKNQWSPDSVGSDISLNFVEGKQLFQTGEFWYFTSEMRYKNQVDFNIGVVPYPTSDDENQEYYVPTIGSMGYVFPNIENNENGLTTKVLVNIIDNLYHGFENESKEEYKDYLEEIITAPSKYKESSINAIMNIEENFTSYRFFDYMSIVDHFLTSTSDFTMDRGYRIWSLQILQSGDIEGFLSTKQTEYQLILDNIMGKIIK